MDGDEVSRDNFPLPNLSRRLRSSSETLHMGRGFVVIRGLEASRYTVEDSVTVFLGVASYIAEKRGRQDRKGNMLCKFSSPLISVPANISPNHDQPTLRTRSSGLPRSVPVTASTPTGRW